ncbi:AM410 family tick-upregulated protein [Anaplasma capra]|uniref:AM410 family tick-upregulated protein n=1 Tax=Anaplasma capra TaxID=1562740 RepID=UPI0021D60BCA|nr:hypothetical protein [Anaplasma capra]MCU7612135.1 hypothetical protein [Anaplasma capra]
MSSEKGLQHKASEALKQAKKGVSIAADAFTTPPTKSEYALTTRNTWQNIKDLFNRIKGGDEWSPFKARVGRIENTPSERKRGNDVSASYGIDGRLVIKVADYAFNGEALKILDAVDSSEDKKLDPHSSAFRLDFSSDTIIDVKKILNNKKAMKGYDNLMALRAELEKCGGEISVERSQDGFSRVLKVTLDTANKTEKEIQHEIELVLECAGLRNKKLAQSLAKEMAYKRDSEHTGADRSRVSSAINAASPPKDEGSRDVAGNVRSGVSATSEEHVQDSGVDSATSHSVDSSVSRVGDDMVLGSSDAAARQAAGAPGVLSAHTGDITPASFDLAAAAGEYVKSQIGVNYNGENAAKSQTAFLENYSAVRAGLGEHQAKDADLHSLSGVSHDTLRGASAGLDGVTDAGQQQEATFSPSATAGQSVAAARTSQASQARD